eukprot:scaffold152315_cov30-Tisochrysis_lutea.AAC.2
MAGDGGCALAAFGRRERYGRMGQSAASRSPCGLLQQRAREAAFPRPRPLPLCSSVALADASKQ